MMRKGYMSAYASQFPQPAHSPKTAQEPTDGIETSRRSFFRQYARFLHQSRLADNDACQSCKTSELQVPAADGREFAQSCATSRFLTHSDGAAAVNSSLEAGERL
jgi:hypothetical protein